MDLYVSNRFIRMTEELEKLTELEFHAGMFKEVLFHFISRVFGKIGTIDIPN